MKCPNCEKEIADEKANYCGLYSYWLREPPYKSFIERLDEKGKHEITRLIIPLLHEKYDFFEKMRKEHPMRYKEIRECKDFFEIGFMFGFHEGIAHRMREQIKENEEKTGADQQPERDHIRVPKSGKSGFEIVKLYNYPKRNHAIIRLKKGVIESLGLPYNSRLNKPLLAEVRNSVLLLKVIEDLVHEEFE